MFFYSLIFITALLSLFLFVSETKEEVAEPLPSFIEKHVDEKEDVIQKQEIIKLKTPPFIR